MYPKHEINLVDPTLYNHLRSIGSGGQDLIVGHRGSSDQLHIHNHGDGLGQTISFYDEGRAIARTTSRWGGEK
jgi:hypothetical protein